MLVCKKCKTTKLDGKWIPTHNVRKNVTYTLCPTCANEVKQVVQGTLLIDGTFFQQNSRQSLQLIQVEERRARSQNVYSRVVQIQQNRNPVIIKTTNSLLAIQIGKQFKRMFRGRLDISRDRNKHTLVRWIFENGHPASNITKEVESTS